VQILDLTALMSVYGKDSTSDEYEQKYDFNDDKEIQILDMSTLMSNYSEGREIE
jgi:hypothetical protein